MSVALKQLLSWSGDPGGLGLGVGMETEVEAETEAEVEVEAEARVTVATWTTLVKLSGPIGLQTSDSHWEFRYYQPMTGISSLPTMADKAFCRTRRELKDEPADLQSTPDRQPSL